MYLQGFNHGVALSISLLIIFLRSTLVVTLFCSTHFKNNFTLVSKYVDRTKCGGQLRTASIDFSETIITKNLKYATVLKLL